ncbi:MAG: hypothetical protein K2H84_07015 [Paramuribaculum sp.]|nr:hypothetical protein [Paramuribaculum sp.]
MTLNDCLQLAGVFVALAICVAYIVRKILRKRKMRECDHDECGGCPLADRCKGHHNSGSCGCG